MAQDMPGSPAAVITPAYRDLQARMHADFPTYGSASVAYAPLVARVVESLKINTLLDYGAGKGRLAASLATVCRHPVRVIPYDPAIPDWAASPAPAEMVASIDVLEHIEPECLDAVLDDLQRVMLRVGFLSIHTGPARKLLADGRNAHLIQAPPAWWLPQLEAQFRILRFQEEAMGFWILVAPRAAQP